MVFAIAVLAGIGIDVLIRSHNARAVRRWMGAGFTGSAILLLALWALGRGHLPPSEAAIRANSFIWPAIGTTVGLLLVATLAILARPSHRAGAAGVPRRHKRTRWVALSLLACETISLFAAGVILWSSTPSICRTSSEEALQRAVGSSLVGFGYPYFISFNVNDVYGVQEFDVYDPMTPESYFRTWHAQTGEVAGVPSEFKFVPAVQTATIPRRYGVGYVLVPRGLPGPQGAVFDSRVGGYKLYRIRPALATLTPIGRNQAWPKLNALGRPVPVTHSNPASWELVTSSEGSPQVLRLRLTDVPGWHGTIDGRPLTLRQFSGFMLQARIPPGDHHIQLSYSPAAFTAGILLAGCSATAIVAALFISWIRHRPRGQQAAILHGTEPPPRRRPT